MEGYWTKEKVLLHLVGRRRIRDKRRLVSLWKKWRAKGNPGRVKQDSKATTRREMKKGIGEKEGGEMNRHVGEEFQCLRGRKKEGDPFRKKK